MVRLPVDSVGWGMVKGFPWWPLYVLDPDKLKPTLEVKSASHQDLLDRAKASRTQMIVYYFGSYDLWVPYLTFRD
ncbi:unnamed protein product [Aphanomyces euteiches]